MKRRREERKDSEREAAGPIHSNGTSSGGWIWIPTLTCRGCRAAFEAAPRRAAGSGRTLARSPPATRSTWGPSRPPLAAPGPHPRAPRTATSRSLPHRRPGLRPLPAHMISSYFFPPPLRPFFLSLSAAASRFCAGQRKPYPPPVGGRGGAGKQSQAGEKTRALARATRGHANTRGEVSGRGGSARQRRHRQCNDLSSDHPTTPAAAAAAAAGPPHPLRHRDVTRKSLQRIKTKN